MVNTGHRVRVCMAAMLDDGTPIELDLSNGGEIEFTLGTGEVSSHIESIAASLNVGESYTWNTPAVRVLGPSMVGRDVTYEVRLLADLGRTMTTVAAEHVHHEYGCSCGCDKLRNSLTHA